MTKPLAAHNRPPIDRTDFREIGTFSCPNCGRSFTGNRGRGRPRRFCSPDCALAFSNAIVATARREERKKGARCLECGWLFHPAASRGRRPTICSPVCKRVRDIRRKSEAARRVQAINPKLNRPV